MSLRMRCVSTVRAFLRTRGAWSVNLQDKGNLRHVTSPLARTYPPGIDVRGPRFKEIGESTSHVRCSDDCVCSQLLQRGLLHDSEEKLDVSLAVGWTRAEEREHVH